MTFAMAQEDMKIEMVGTVTPPPDLSTILRSIGEAAKAKQSYVLSPGMARILNDYLESK